ncbi:MAG: methylated-DNA--[protein]-cysteine S-methyltransferase [Clostridiales bacterium]|nr:methylated-DNA--[protein]-cysteine S-methyltransferase [Clostridiales bacterium]
MYKTYYASPIGIIEIKGDEHAVRSILFSDRKDDEDLQIPALLQKCRDELDAYFKGSLKKFTFKMEPEGTKFQKSVWNALTKIPYGKTASYKEIAQMINNVKAVRAVGNANSKNPLAIAVPCHRIIGSNGNLTGYAGGLWRKEWLINHEKNTVNKRL